ncbi:MAG: BON domain-containing protein [Phenylobacterium sp.]|nr:BON domain-containing protein [Phenylobacterium sp.]
MAGRWEDDREWRERDAQFSRGYPGEDYEPREPYRGSEARSFQRGPRGPVFGERESGASYSSPREARDGYAGSGRPFGSPIRGADRTYGGGHTEAERNRAYRAAYGPHPDRDRGDRYDDRHDERNFLDRAADTVASWFGEGRPDSRRNEPFWGGSHRGRGPQGYQRSDERITEEVHERLTEDRWLDASNITISVAGGEVTLSGTVTDRDAKHRAERLVEDITGVGHVQNNLRAGAVDRGPGDSFQDPTLKPAARRGDA